MARKVKQSVLLKWLEKVMNGQRISFGAWWYIPFCMIVQLHLVFTGAWLAFHAARVCWDIHRPAHMHRRFSVPFALSSAIFLATNTTTSPMASRIRSNLSKNKKIAVTIMYLHHRVHGTSGVVKHASTRSVHAYVRRKKLAKISVCTRGCENGNFTREVEGWSTALSFSLVFLDMKALAAWHLESIPTSLARTKGREIIANLGNLIRLWPQYIYMYV